MARVWRRRRPPPVRGDTAFGDFKPRHARDRADFVTTTQTLPSIRNGDDELCARVRRSGHPTTACLRVSVFGGPALPLVIPASATGTDVRRPHIPVSEQTVTVSIISEADAGDWLEVDEVPFMKPPLPGRQPRPSRSFAYRGGDPLWQLAQSVPRLFSGDEKFCLFGRDCGVGEARTVSWVMQPAKRSDLFPITRLPKTGRAGRGAGLSAAGDISFRLGSHAEHRDVVARAGYRAGAAIRVTCVYDRRSAPIYLEGKLSQRADGLTFSPADRTAPGRLGANSGLYDAVGDGTLTPDVPPPKAQRCQSDAGTLGDIRTYNRALTAAEVARLAAALL